MDFEGLAWLLVLPAVAECVASVWLPELEYKGFDVKTAFLNISGAAFEGLFASWENGRRPRGALGAAVASLSGVVRSSFLAAYTSWAGMVGYAAVMAFETGSLGNGLAYMTGCMLTGIIAYRIAAFIGAKLSSEGAAPASHKQVRLALLGGCVAFVAASYGALATEVTEIDLSHGVWDDSGLPALLRNLDAEENRLLVAMFMAITGAAAGNALGGMVDGTLKATGDVAVGTLCCNALFALLGLLLPVASLRRALYGRSVLLQSFSGSFCGAASAFAGTCGDSATLSRCASYSRALKNVTANLALAMLVCYIGFEVESLRSQFGALDFDKNGVLEVEELTAYYGLGPALMAPARKRFLGVF